MDDIESVDLARFKRANSRMRKESSKVTFNLSDSVEAVSSRISGSCQPRSRSNSFVFLAWQWHLHRICVQLKFL